MTPSGLTGSQDFLLPDLGEGLTEAEIVTWLVAEGDMIVIDQPVVEVESAKSSVELPSPFAGRIQRLYAQPGDVVHKGDVLVSVVGGDAGDPLPELVPGTAVRASETGSGAVLIGYGTKEPTAKARRTVVGGRFGRTAGEPNPEPGLSLEPNHPLAPDHAIQPDYSSEPNDPLVPDYSSEPNEPLVVDHSEGRRLSSAPNAAPVPVHSPVISPLVRRQARSHGIDASTLHGTGPGFLVTREDVDAAIATMEAHARNRGEHHDGAQSGPMAPTTSSGAGGASGSGNSRGSRGSRGSGDSGSSRGSGGPDDAAADIRTPIAGMRKIIGSRLSHSRSTIPEATIWLDVDATGLFEAKSRLEKSTGERFSLTALLARFVVAALKQYPVLNSSVDDERGEFVHHSAIHLGLAAQTARGLMVPVIRDASAMTTIQLRDAVADLVTHSQAGDFPAGALTGGTFTLNNYGGFGVDGSTPIINHPEVAMLGVGRMIDRPWVVDGALVVRKVVTLSFVFDHRVCDGDVASGFLTYVAHCVEEPLLLLGTV